MTTTPFNVGMMGRLMTRKAHLMTNRMANRAPKNAHSSCVYNCSSISQYSSAAHTSSISESEVSKFSALSESWWDLEKNPLYYMNPVRVRFILETMRSRQKEYNNVSDKPKVSLEELNVLDVGCGGGLLSESLARLGANVTAIDPSEEIVEVARVHSKMDPRTRKINYRGGISIEDLAQLELDNGFDMICILDVLEHTSDPTSLLRAASSLLRRKSSENHTGGTLFVSTINRTLTGYVGGVVAPEYITGLLPIGTHEWEKFLSPSDIRDMAQGVGLSEIAVKGMVLKPPFIDFRWKLDASDTDINWIGSYQHSPEVDEP